MNVLPSPSVLCDPDLAAEQAGDLPADRQAQARAAVLAAGPRVGLLERLEDDPAACRTGCRCPCRSPRRPRRDSARLEHRVVGAPAARRPGSTRRPTLPVLGELEGVGEEVPEHLLQPLRVGGDRPRAGRRPARPSRSRPLVSATGRKVRSTYSRRSANGTSPTSIAIVPDSILAMSRMSLISESRSEPEA